MRLIPWDPDVETIISRIESGVLNLQPDFQRGEVWSRAKKQRLVDSVLRDWHVPPVHVIENTSTKKQEVLDGQQRLAAIRDFVGGDFAVDGSTEPLAPEIRRLDGLKYRELPEDAKRQFDQFTIRVYRIVDYKTTEPAELFFRLNQPTNLTSAEQRNAFFGPVREQIKRLVDRLPSYGLGKEVLGFSNSRMAYDDVLCRVALTMERNSLALKIGANDLVELYRSDKPLSAETELRLNRSVAVLAEAAAQGMSRPRFNKATIYSWLVFLARGLGSECAGTMRGNFIASFMSYFEAGRLRSSMKLSSDPSTSDAWKSAANNISQDWLFSTYDDRSTSRVADVSSIVLRDVAIWLVFSEYTLQGSPEAADSLPTRSLVSALEGIPNVDEEAVAKAALEDGWGSLQ